MKRLLSWLLALVMIISCLPMSAIPAFAEETPETGVEETTGPSDFETPIDKLDPVVIEELGNQKAVQIAGDAEGNFYIYTAPADGTVTLYFTEVPESVKKYEGDIIVTVNDKVYSLKENGVYNYGLELQIPVKKGDVLEINTKLTADHQGNAYPKGDYTWCINFAYPIGSEQNPITIQWTWDDAYANATATVTVPEGGAYYTGKAGMILTVGETVTAMDETGKFNIAAAGTYELKLATPVGAQANPEVIENINDFSDTVKLEAEGAYYYIWTATENGTVTLDVTEGANIVVDQIVEMSEDGQPVSVQHQLAAVEYDDNWNAYWAVADNLAIEVVAGQQLKIQVNGLTDWATWSVPAIEYTLTGSFEPAEEPVVELDLTMPKRANSLMLEGMIQIRATVAFMNNDRNANTKEFTKDYIVANGGVLFWNASEFPGNELATFATATSVSALDTGAGTYKGKNDIEAINEYWAYSMGIPAKNYGDTVYFRAYLVVDGEYVYGDVAEYSVRTYCENKLSKEKPDKVDCKPLCATILNYGAAAQLYFAKLNKTVVAPEDLVNNNLQSFVDAGTMDAKYLNLNWDSSYIIPHIEADASISGNFSDTGAKRTASTLFLEGAIEIQSTFGYNLTGNFATKLPDDATVTIYYWTTADYNALLAAGTALSIDNASYKVSATGYEIRNSSDCLIKETYDATYGYEYRATCEGIPAKLLSGTTYVTAEFEVGDDVYASRVRAYSAHTFANNKINKSKIAEEVTLCKWIVIYGMEADAYFTQLNG